LTTGDAARVTVMVAVRPEVAFEVFTREVDLWWRRGPKFRPLGRKPGVLAFEGGGGGRLFEALGGGRAPQIIEVGRITAWEPPERLAFDWRNSAFAQGKRTHMEVTFKPIAGKTEVTVEHTGWSSLRESHPARHGLAGAAFARSLGMFWGELMSAMREHVGLTRPPVEAR
jgi:uncharacterized protein YndB with AHSA1/START domain